MDTIVRLDPDLIRAVGRHILETNKQCMRTSITYIKLFDDAPIDERLEALKLANDALETRKIITETFIRVAKALEDADYKIYM